MDQTQWAFPGHSYPVPDLLVTVLSIVCIAAFLPTNTVQAQNSETRIEFLKYGAMATNVAVSRDGGQIAVGVREVPGGGSQVVLWEHSLQQRVWRRSFESNRAPNVTFDSTGTQLALARGPEGIVIVNTEDGRTVKALEEIPNDLRTTFETDASARRVAFGPSSSQAVFKSGETQIRFLNYDLNPEKTIETSTFCQGKVLEVKLPPNSSNILFTTQAYATCDPDYLCVVNPASNALVSKYSRKNISQIEIIGNGEVAYSRGKYVYRLNLRSGAEEIVYTSDNTVQDLAYANGRLVIANSDVVILEI